jgi:hypothetical protein
MKKNHRKGATRASSSKEEIGKRDERNQRKADKEEGKMKKAQLVQGRRRKRVPVASGVRISAEEAGTKRFVLLIRCAAPACRGGRA